MTRRWRKSPLGAKAIELGLRRLKTGRFQLTPPRYVSSIRFEAATFDEVVGWLRKHGHRVEPGLKPGLWKMGCFDAQTPQMVVRLANDRRARTHGLPPFRVDNCGVAASLPQETGIQTGWGST